MVHIYRRKMVLNQIFASIPARICGRVHRLSSTALIAAMPLLIGMLGAAYAPSTVAADADIASPPIYATGFGPPDGRVYEQVSPTNKNGNEAGVGTNPYLYGGGTHYSVATADGNSIIFWGSGPMGTATAGYNLYFVARRSAEGWSTKSAIPRYPVSVIGGATLGTRSYWIDPSSDLSHIVFDGQTLPINACSNGLSAAGIEPPTLGVALAEPQIPDYAGNCGGAAYPTPAGGTPDFSTVYFSDPGTLLPEDAGRAPYVSEGNVSPYAHSPWGFYEYKDGKLKEVGILPNGSLDPFGAIPAGFGGHEREVDTHQVSDDGSRAFFVSPDPGSCGYGNDCTADPPELYVRESGQRTVLVSEDVSHNGPGELLGGAPDGVTSTVAPEPLVPGNNLYSPGESFVYAAPDGSHAFFQSGDHLTDDAPAGPPADMSSKTYDFDVDTGSLTYLPGVSGHIVASSTDGSSVAFVSATSSPVEIERWEAGPDGGKVTAIAPLAEASASGVSVARMSNNGSVLVFQTEAPIPGFNNGGSHLGRYGEHVPGTEQIYRYDASSNSVSCVSCPPVGMTPTSNAVMSALQADGIGPNRIIGEEGELVDERGISADGSRIVFDTADPLVSQDIDARPPTLVNPEESEIEEHGRDVYEWENGADYLISSGKNSENSYVLDNSESGDDVFFATAEGMAAGDTDGAYDVYDARVPHQSDESGVAAVPCQGSGCQGPSRAPGPLEAPTSATFSGFGNTPPSVSVKQIKKPKLRPRRARCKEHYVNERGRCVKKRKAAKPHSGTSTSKVGGR